MKRFVKILPCSTWLLAALSAGALGCSPTGLANEVPTLVIERSERFVRHIMAEGHLQAVESTPLTAPPDARRGMRIAWIEADGTAVKEGDVVVRFDVTEMQRQLKDSQDDVAIAAEQIQKERRAGSAAEQKRDRSARLAEVEAEIARSFEGGDESYLSRNEIIESKIDVEFSSAKAKHAGKVKVIERKLSRNKRELFEIDKRLSTAAVKRAQEGLTNLEIKAPHAGILMLQRGWSGKTLRIGDSVWRSQKVAKLPLVTSMQAELFVLEAGAGDLKVDLSAELVIEAHPQRVYEAKVKRVDTLAKPRHPDVPVQYFGVTLELAETDTQTMKVGGRVRAKILLEQENAIVVPRQAVFVEEGRTFVYRKSRSGFDAIDVTLGSSSAGRIVIVQGLEQGDTIALRDPTKAADELLAAESPDGGKQPSAGKRPGS